MAADVEVLLADVGLILLAVALLAFIISMIAGRPIHVQIRVSHHPLRIGFDVGKPAPDDDVDEDTGD